MKGQTVSNGLRLPAARAALLALVMFACAGAARAQDCDNLSPSGDTSGNVDSANINTCLASANHATLGAGTFYVAQPIMFSVPNQSLAGAGRLTTILTPTYSCTPSGEPVIDVNGQGGRNPSNAVVRDFYLDLTNLGGSCTIIGVRFIRATGGTVSGLTISGTGSSTSGGASASGIQLVKSSNVLVSNNKVKDMGSAQPGGGGIAVEDSPNATVDSNRVTHLPFGITVRNNDNASGGGVFDSSNTRVTNNTITSSQGRAMKIAASDVNSVPLRNLVITGNSATDFGKTGLYLTGGVQDSRIENNSFVGNPNCFYGLWVGSREAGTLNPGLKPTFNNQINFNTFVGGSLGFDVSFNGSPNAAGPDQPTISRGSAGNNTLGPLGIDHTANFCSQYSHAWFIYPTGFTYLPANGAYLTLAAAGIRQGTRVTYHFKLGGTEYAVRTTNGTGQSNCVLNQEQVFLSLPAGLYDVYVDLQDGNARYPDPNTGASIAINNWLLATKLDVH